MAFSPILAIPQIGESQNNKYLTANNADQYLEAAEEDTLTKTTAGTTAITLTESEATRYKMYKIDPGTASGAFNLVWPSTVNGNATKRIFMVWNNSGFAVTVKGAGAGTTVVLRTGQRAICHQAGDNITLVAYVVAAEDAYDIGFFVSGQPGNAAYSGTYRFPRSAEMADDFAGSYGFCGTNPSATATFDVKKNGTSIGSVAISTGGAFTFATTGSGVVSWAAGDRLDLIGPTPQDGALADVAITFKGVQLS